MGNGTTPSVLKVANESIVAARCLTHRDYAAAALLLSEAGGALTTLQGEPFLDALPLEQSGGWLAATTGLHPSLLAAIPPLLEQLPSPDGGR